MNRQQKQVRDFNRAILTDRRETPGIPSHETRLLRARLILEEALEVVQGLGFQATVNPIFDSVNSHFFNLGENPDGPNLAEVVDGLCDLKYVTDGAADVHGVDLEPFFEEVHYTNMQKLNGPKDEHGKQLKPEGWKPPRIAEMLKSIENVPQTLQHDMLTPYLLRTKAR